MYIVVDAAAAGVNPAAATRAARSIQNRKGIAEKGRKSGRFRVYEGRRRRSTGTPVERLGSRQRPAPELRESTGAP
jgi:hypothetical protein